MLEAEAVAVELKDVDVVGQPVEERAGEPLGAHHGRPFVKGKIGGDDGRAAFMALAEHVEQQLGAGARKRDIARLVDDQELYRF